MHDSFKEIAITEADRERLRNDMLHRRELKFKESEEKRNGNQRNNGNRPRSDRSRNSVYAAPQPRGQARGANQKRK